MLHDVSFTARPGQVTAIVGSTGCGKSTLLNLIPRFYDVTDGAVKVDGCDVKDFPLQTLRGKIGLVPQKALLFLGTIRDNLRWGKENATDEELYEALRAGQPCTTSAVNVEAFTSAMEPLLAAGKDVLCIAFSSGDRATKTGCMVRGSSPV